jgi:hypothetical protein
MRDVAELVEMNRFVGREFLLWLWFESELFETNLKPSKGPACSLWLETQLTLKVETEEARIKCPAPAAAPEAKQALQQGKLPQQARVHALVGEHEFTWVMKAEELAIGSLKIPAQLKADDDKYEALYDRMRLTEELEAVLEQLFSDFITLRLAAGWETSIVPEMKRWARGKPVDEKAYTALKEKLLKKR